MKHKSRFNMTSKIILEIDLDEIEKVKAPVLYSTPVGEFDHINKVNALDRVTKYIQRSPDDIVNMDHRNRKYFLDGIIKDFCSSVFDKEELYFLAQRYDAWLMNHREGTGYDFKTVELTYEVKCNGEKYKLKEGNALFLTEKDLVKVVVENFIKGDFNYKIIK